MPFPMQMTFPFQWSWLQVVLVLVAVAAIGLIISSIMSLVVKVKEIELLEDEQGRSYRLMRRRRRFRLHHGVGGLLLLCGSDAHIGGISCCPVISGFHG